MDFRALGAIAVIRDGEPVELGGRKPRSVLALLLANRNTVVPTDRILHELWGDDADGKLNALRVHVSRLRVALEPDRARGEESVLQTTDTGYRLEVADDRYDVARFEAAVTEGRRLLSTDPRRAIELISEALDDWTGEAFAEFADEPFAQSEIHRLSELRIDAIEDRIEAEMATGLDRELVGELEVLRREHPLREQLVHHQALALYRSGRPAEGLRAISRFRRHLGDELGLDPSPRLLRLEEQMLLHDDAIQPELPEQEHLSAPTRPVTNPYRGLLAFGTDDAASFFGRDALIAELMRTIGRGERLVTVVGASGSGKSSVVRAGLLPALAKDALEGSERWLVAGMVPGPHPFAELEAALLRSTLDAPASLAEQLDDGEAGLLRAALRLLPDEHGHLLLVIDQFEELFTLVDDDEVLERFLANLVTAVDDPHQRITVVLTLRADFYGRPLAHPAFGARLGSGIVNVTPMTAEELEAAALRPAEEQGVGCEPALLGQLIAAVGNQPGSLPLFQYTLTELFDRRTDDKLTTEAYRSMGGLEGALQRRATELFDELEPDQREAARQLFLRLTVVGENDQRTRRRVPAREIASLDVDPTVIQHVVGQFGRARLLSFDADPLTGAPTVEVAHEALLVAWPVLDEWIEESREDLRHHASLATALREWELADRDSAYLLTPARLAAFGTLGADSSISLNGPEREFIAASRAIHDADDRRRADEAKARRRLWAVVGALGVALGIAALALSGVFASDVPTVTFFGNRGDGSWNASLASGLDRAARERDLNVVDVPWVVDPGVEFRELLETEPEMVMADGLALTPGVVANHPDVQFGVVDVDVRGPNVTSVSFANEEGAFLAGAAAALRTETGVVGFIGAEQFPLIAEFQAGFEAGVQAVDSDVTVISVFINQFGGINGFVRPELAAARARALFDRDVDVVFTAAGFSGFGTFEAAFEYSRESGRHVWAIGVDNDQWFEVPPAQRPHVLTSIIKRGDLASYRLVNHMLDGGSTGPIDTLGLADDAFNYSTEGDGLTPHMRDWLDKLVASVKGGRVEVPTIPSGEVLVVDNEGNEISASTDGASDELVGVDGLVVEADVEPGAVELTALGTPVSLTFEPGWSVARNQPGDTAFVRLSAPRFGTTMLAFFRAHVLADPGDNAAPPIRAEDIEGWLDAVDIGVDARGRREIGGREATYFEVTIDSEACGSQGWCYGFVANRVRGGNIAGWSFEPGFRSRVWWIDGGDESPLVVVASTMAGDEEGTDALDALIATLEIGETRANPVPFEESGF